MQVTSLHCTSRLSRAGIMPVASRLALGTHLTGGRQVAPASRRCIQMASGAEHPVDLTVKPLLFDVPLSNNGARCRIIIYKKGLEEEIGIVSPAVLGGLKSAEYLALNPQGKMPLLTIPGGDPIPESEVISQYLLDKYSDIEPSFTLATPEGRAKAASITRVLDIYINSIQGCMYRPMEAQQRADNLKAINYQLDALEQLVDPHGPWLAGPLSGADAAVFPTMIFIYVILPEFFGWSEPLASRPRLQAWWAHAQTDPIFAKVFGEVEGGLLAWKESGRWDSIVEQIAENPSLQFGY